MKASTVTAMGIGFVFSFASFVCFIEPDKHVILPVTAVSIAVGVIGGMFFYVCFKRNEK